MKKTATALMMALAVQSAFAQSTPAISSNSRSGSDSTFLQSSVPDPDYYCQGSDPTCRNYTAPAQIPSPVIPTQPTQTPVTPTTGTVVTTTVPSGVACGYAYVDYPRQGFPTITNGIACGGYTAAPEFIGAMQLVRHNDRPNLLPGCPSGFSIFQMSMTGTFGSGSGGTAEYECIKQ